MCNYNYYKSEEENMLFKPIQSREKAWHSAAGPDLLQDV